MVILDRTCLVKPDVQVVQVPNGIPYHRLLFWTIQYNRLNIYKKIRTYSFRTGVIKSGLKSPDYILYNTQRFSVVCKSRFIRGPFFKMIDLTD